MDAMTVKKNSTKIVEPKSQVLCSQETAPVHILSKLNHVYIFKFFLFKIHFNIIFPSMQSLLTVIFPSGVPTKPLYAFLLSHACHMPHPSHSPSFDHHNEMLLGRTNHEVPPYTLCSSLLLLPSSYIKSKVHPVTGHEGPEGV